MYPALRTTVPARSRRTRFATKRSPQHHPSPHNLEASASITAPASQSAQPGQWLTTFKAEEAEILLTQSVYADLVLNGHADEAFARYRRTNKTNVYTALFLYGVRCDRVGLCELAFRFLVQNCRAIARQKGLRDKGTLNDEVYVSACDKMLTELLDKLKTPLDTARLLLGNQLPTGVRANFGMVLRQRLQAELGFSDSRIQKAAALADGIDELYPNLYPDPVRQAKLQQTEAYSSDYATQHLVELIDSMKDGLTQREIALWQAATAIKHDPKLHWDAVCVEFISKTGDVPTTAALRQQWSRLRTRLREKYQRFTQREHPTARIFAEAVTNSEVSH